MSNDYVVKHFIDLCRKIPTYSELQHLPDREFKITIDQLKSDYQRYSKLVNSDDLSRRKLNLDKQNNNTKKSSSRYFDKNTKPILNSARFNKSIDSSLRCKSASPTRVRIKSIDSDDLESCLSLEKCNITDTSRKLKYSNRRSKDRSKKKTSDEIKEILYKDLQNEVNSSDPNIRPKSAIDGNNYECSSGSSCEYLSDIVYDSNLLQKYQKKYGCQRLSRLYESDSCLDTRKRRAKKDKLFRAHPVPIQVRIPLFDKIMAQKAAKSRQVREARKLELLADEKPFNFWLREQERLRRESSLRCRHSRYFTHDTDEDEQPYKRKFKANPFPKHLFSDEVDKMNLENEIQRSLNRRFRAEELLRSSSLPRSMAEREDYQQRKSPECKQYWRSTPNTENSPSRARSPIVIIPNFKKSQERFAQKIQEKKKENITTTPQPFNLATDELGQVRKDRCARSLSPAVPLRKLKSSIYRPKSFRSPYYTSLSSASPRRSAITPKPTSQCTDNVASQLRVQASRKRLEQNMAKDIQNHQRSKFHKIQSILLRSNPAWDSIKYTASDDIAMRYVCRLEEADKRKREYQRLMDDMMARVWDAPLLLETGGFKKCINGCIRSRDKGYRYSDVDYGFTPSPDPISDIRRHDENKEDMDNRNEHLHYHNEESNYRNEGNGDGENKENKSEKKKEEDENN